MIIAHYHDGDNYNAAVFSTMENAEYHIYYVLYNYIHSFPDNDEMLKSFEKAYIRNNIRQWAEKHYNQFQYWFTGGDIDEVDDIEREYFEQLDKKKVLI